jgi:hypothetical protein
VSGPGRSGTSAVARVLHESGVHMGDDLRPPSEFNRAGFYEPGAVCDLNDAIMADLRMEGLKRWPWRATVLAAAERNAGEMARLAAGAAGGWKDPRFCFTLEAWLPHLPRRPKLVVCLRSPEAYFHSVVSIYGLATREVVERSWVRQLRRLLEVVRDYRLEATCVEYDALVSRPREAVAALAAFVGWPLDARYVEAELRQFAQPVPARFERLYREVRSLGAAASV